MLLIADAIFQNDVYSLILHKSGYAFENRKVQTRGATRYSKLKARVQEV